MDSSIKRQAGGRAASTNARVEAATGADLVEIAALHYRAFPRFFLSSLGERFLYELYLAIVEDPTGIVLVERTGGVLRGFVAGTVQPTAFYRRLALQRSWHFALAAIPAVVRRPLIVPRLMRAFGRATTAHPASCALLMSIAVDPASQGHGVGGALIRSFISVCRTRGVRSVMLHTDRLDNMAVNDFYSRHGFIVQRAFVTPERREMNEYITYLE